MTLTVTPYQPAQAKHSKTLQHTIHTYAAGICNKTWSFLLSLDAQTHSSLVFSRVPHTSSMSALVALSLFVVSTVGSVAELEPPEPSCLLQKAKEQQEQLVARELHQVKPLEQQLEEQVKAFVSGPPAPFGSAFECGPNCRCSDFVNQILGVGIDACFAHCQGFPGFIFAPFDRPRDCMCCRDLDQNMGVTTEWYLYSQTLPPPAPSGYDFKCGPNCRCEGFGNSNPSRTIGQCADLCASEAGFIFAPLGPPQDTSDCQCCSDLVEERDVPTQWYLYAPSGGGSTGDPHINTFDGRHYTLLSQGTFSLWHFSGVETDFHSEETGGTKKFPVDWQVYAHYSGQGLTFPALCIRFWLKPMFFDGEFNVGCLSVSWVSL